jgi:hypothetical protein
MKRELEERLATLRTEQDGARDILAELEAQHARTRDTLLCIGGAIAVLEELLDAGDMPAVEPAIAAVP